MHWGYEYHNFPNKEQRALSKWLHEQGADMVIGSHPHVVQPIEYYTSDKDTLGAVSYTHLRAHETRSNLVCRLLLEKIFF